MVAYATLSDYAENTLLDLVVGNQSYTPSTNIDHRLYLRSSAVSFDSVDNTTNQLTKATHGLSADTPVLLSSSGTLPTGLSEQTRYYVQVVDTNTIQLALTPGGTAVTFSDNGSGTHSYHLALTDAAGGASEVSGGGYSSVLLTNNLTNYPAASGGSKSNGVAVSYSDPSGAWGNVAEMAWWDDEATPNMLAIATLTSLKNIVATTTNIQFAISALTLAFSQGTTTGIFQYLANELLDHMIGGSAYTPPATLYLALLTAQPGFTDTGSTLTEVSGNNYSRASLTNNATNFPAASGGSKTAANPFAFATPSGSWGTPTYWALLDAATLGNALFWGAITTPAAINSGDTVEHTPTFTMQ